MSEQLPQTINGDSRAQRALKDSVKPEMSNISKIVEEMDQDYQVSFGYLTIKSLLSSTKVAAVLDTQQRSPEQERFISTQQSYEEKDIKTRPELLVDYIDELWRGFIASAAEAYKYGRKAYEKVYNYDAKTGLKVMQLLPLDHKVSEMRIEKSDGSFDGIDIKGMQGHLTPSESLWIAIDSDIMKPYGRSRYLGAPYQTWKKRNDLADREDTFYRKLAIGKGIARAPSSMPDNKLIGKGDVGQVGNDGKALNPMQVMKSALSEIESGGDLVLSSDKDDAGQYLWDYIESVGVKDASSFENKRRAMDSEMLRAMGIPERAISQDTAVGSNSMADTHKEVLENTIEGLLEQILDQFQLYVVNKLVELNFDPSENVSIKMTYQPMSDDRKVMVVELVKALVLSPQTSALVTSGVIDIERLLEIADLPTASDLSQALERFKTISAQAAQAPVPNGASMSLEEPEEASQSTWVDAAEGNSQELKETLEELLGSINAETSQDVIRSRL